METRPILLGKLNHINNMYTLMGEMGDIRRIDFKEYEILKAMDGFKTIEEIAVLKNVDVEEIEKIYYSYKGKKKVLDLYEWNNVGWCQKCQVHVSGDKCGICGGKIKKVEFSPPCDPFIGFREEQKFILKVLHEKFNINSLPENAFFLINCGINDNCFFWEVEYAGRIILKIDFKNNSPNFWQYTLMDKVENIIGKKECLFNQVNLKRNIAANEKYLNKIENQSMAIIAESTTFFESDPLLYFSSGKESMVMLSLLEKMRIKANVLTVVTGVEFPEDIIFIKKMQEKIEKNTFLKYFFYQDDGTKVINMLNKEKKLSAKNPWCRVEFKRKLKNKGTEEIYKGEDFVAYEGSRWYENDFRRRHPKVNFLSDYSHQVWIHPLAEWTSYDIWLYIFKEKLEINPVYFKGFQRTTCWLCPIVSPIHLYNSKRHYPQLWEKIKECEMDAFEDDTTHDLPF